MNREEINQNNKSYPIRDMDCYKCNRYTPHWIMRESNHERDGSADSWQCTVCLWEYCGYSGGYHKPDCNWLDCSCEDEWFEE
jgi:hypothetical protein